MAELLLHAQSELLHMDQGSLCRTAVTISLAVGHKCCLSLSMLNRRQESYALAFIQACKIACRVAGM